MDVTCEILFKDRNRGHYKPGDLVKGTIKYTICEQIEISSVTLSLVGKGLRFVQSSIGWVHIASEDYVKQCIDLIKTKTKIKTVLTPGDFKQKFEFVLPEEIPSTYKDETCQIKYNIILKIIKPNSPVSTGEIKRFKREIIIHENIHPISYVVQTEKKYATFISGDNNVLKIKAVIENAAITAGDEIIIKLYINNASKVPISAIKAELVSHISCLSEYKVEYESKVLKPTVKEFPGVAPDISSTIFLSVPTLSDIYSVLKSKVIRREYKVKLTVKVPFPYKSTTIEIPVMIEGKTDLKTNLAETEPPSIWQVMNEVRNGKEIKSEEIMDKK